jgi:hypothetical protein
MIKHTKDKKVLIVLRLWKTQTQFTDNQLALFIGSTNFQDAAHSYITLHPRSLINLLHGGGLLQLINALQQSHLQWKTIKIHHAIVPKKIKRLNWDQKILVIREQGSSPD